MFSAMMSHLNLQIVLHIPANNRDKILLYNHNAMLIRGIYTFFVSWSLFFYSILCFPAFSTLCLPCSEREREKESNPFRYKSVPGTAPFRSTEGIQIKGKLNLKCLSKGLGCGVWKQRKLPLEQKLVTFLKHWALAVVTPEAVSQNKNNTIHKSLKKKKFNMHCNKL